MLRGSAGHVLVLNSGSSSLKWTVLEAATEAIIDEGSASWEGTEGGRHAAEVAVALARVATVDAVGHRVVHGGHDFTESVLIDDSVYARIADLAELAPLHNPAALAGINAARAKYPGVPQVAAFDTAFHSTIPNPAAVYPVPWEWTERWGLRRFGFHGLSVHYAVSRATQLVGKRPSRIVVCHLGAGCSVTAVAAGRSIETSMGFTPLEGVMMARRSGSVDPGLLLYLLTRQHLDGAGLDKALNEQSGLGGVSGVSADMRDVLRASADGTERAALALDMFIHRVVGAVGSMSAHLGGLDCLIFTGGIGEHSSEVRARIANPLGFLGLELEDAANQAASGDAIISVPTSGAIALVVTAREDLTILRDVKRLIERS